MGKDRIVVVGLLSETLGVKLGGKRWNRVEWGGMGWFEAAFQEVITDDRVIL